MEEILNAVVEFLKNNWKEVVQVAFLVISLIATIVIMKKKGASLSDILNSVLGIQLPIWVTSAENTGETGEKKKITVINCALNHIAKLMGRSLTEEETAFIVTKVSEQIEKILETPQKKEIAQEPKKTKYR